MGKPKKSRSGPSGPSLSRADRPSPKFEVTFTPELLVRLDAIVEARGTTRSETLRHLVDTHENNKIGGIMNSLKTAKNLAELHSLCVATNPESVDGLPTFGGSHIDWTRSDPLLISWDSKKVLMHSVSRGFFIGTREAWGITE